MGVEQLAPSAGRAAPSTPRNALQRIADAFARRAPPALGFAAVLRRELRAIRARRVALEVARSRPLEIREDDDPFERAWQGRLLGVTFSGGGIRSATFNLGVLQALAGYGLLRHVDYLSTVSGGGYIGSWLTALSQRAFARRNPTDREVVEALTPRLSFDRQGYRDFERELAWSAGDEREPHHEPGDSRESRAIRFLREYSNYLTPKLGVFSADTWALISIYIRNALLNQVVLVLALAFVLMIPRFLAALIAPAAAGVPDRLGLPPLDFWAWFTAVAVAIVSWNLGRNLAGIGDQQRAKPNPATSLGVIGWMLLPLLALGLGAAEWMPLLAERLGDAGWGAAAVLGALVSSAVWAGAWLAALVSPWPQGRQNKFWWRMLVAAPFSGALFGVGAHAAGRMLEPLGYSGFAIMLSVPLLALGVLTAGVLHLGLAGKGFPSQYGEWLSRFGGLTMIGALGWLALTALVFLGPFLIALLPGYMNAALASGWLGTTLAAVVFGRTKATSSRSLLRPVLTTFAPWVFILGLLLALSAAVQQALWWSATRAGIGAAAADFSLAQQERRTAEMWNAYTGWLAAPEVWWFVAAIAAASLGLAFVLSRRIDINTFSLNSMYGNRLVRCYLGASVERRWANPFSGMSGRDDLSLFAVPQDVGGNMVYAHGNVDGEVAREANVPDHDAVAYPGPYHLVNTAINLVAGRSLAWQERKAASFMLSPLYCGFRRLTAKGGEEPKLVDAYRETRDFASKPRCLTLGEAMATSGAAASPNMGHFSSPAFAFLMGVFNIRLGRWVGNPAPNEEQADKQLWRKSGPGVALWHLLREVFGLTHSDSEYVYLSDGGHFENLGLYELVRRRCRYIIVCDAGADGSYGFEDLANAIRKCRVDLGVEIDLDAKQIAEIDALRCNGAPCALGDIRYSDQQVGTLLYIKACRRQGFPSDLLNYATANAAFPHETTADQFFSESQFESYRRLGAFLTKQILERSVAEANGADVDVSKLFRSLRQNWYRSSLSVSTHFTALARSIDDLFERLRTSPELAFLSTQFYPEWRALMAEPRPAAEQAAEMWKIPDDPAELRQSFYFCNSLIQLMETAYIDLNLESEWNHPDNSGWINLFNHWAWSGMFRVTWAVSAAQYGRRFRTFCRQRLNLDLGTVAVELVFAGNAGATPAELSRALDDGRLNLLEQEQVKALTQQIPLGEVGVYRLELGVEIVLVPEQPPRKLRSFVFGYALCRGDELLMFRVQDHLRTMDLGRQGLTKLVRLRLPKRTVLGDTTPILERLERVNERAEASRVHEFRAMLASIVEDIDGSSAGGRGRAL